MVKLRTGGSITALSSDLRAITSSSLNGDSPNRRYFRKNMLNGTAIYEFAVQNDDTNCTNQGKALVPFDLEDAWTLLVLQLLLHWSQGVLDVIFAQGIAQCW